MPITGYLAPGLAAARLANGYLDVTPHLRLPGHDHVFAIGDITAIPEAKMAKAAGLHAEVAAANIRSLIEGGGDLIGYRPGPPGISLPLGPRGGVSYSLDTGVLDAAATSRLKGADLRIDAYAELLGLGSAAAPVSASKGGGGHVTIGT